MTDLSDELDDLSARLESAAARLRSGELDNDAAAAVVDECARLAARAAGELDRRGEVLEPPPGQDPLL